MNYLCRTYLTEAFSLLILYRNNPIKKYCLQIHLPKR